MNCINIKENTKYTFDELSTKLNLSNNKTKDVINQLLRLGILKTNMKLLHDDIELSVGEYTFAYVGLVIVDNVVIKCYPKYIVDKDKVPLSKFKQVLQVLERYRSKHTLQNISIDTMLIEHNNKIALYMYIIRDYIINGMYTQFIDTREQNGNGDIDWDLTINMVDPIIQDKKPYYLDLYTYINTQEDQNFFMRLHQAIVAECMRIFEENDLLELFDLEKFHVSDELVSTFGETEFVCQKLLKELNIQYNDQKRNQLMYMYHFLQNNASSTDDMKLLCYGTQTFHNVWENVCSEVFGNHKNKEIKDIIHDHPNSDTLQKLIKSPTWNIYGKSYNGSGTLIPDVLHLAKDTLYIIDAKYYAIKVENSNIYNYPGVSDLTKQLLYKLAYQEFATTNNREISNIFVFPGDNDEEYKHMGYAELAFLPSSMQIEENEILVYKLSAEKLFEKYLRSQKADIEILKINQDIMIRS